MSKPQSPKIVVNKELKEVLASLGKFNDTYESIIVNLLPEESRKEYERLIKNKK